MSSTGGILMACIFGSLGVLMLGLAVMLLDGLLKHMATRRYRPPGSSMGE